MHFCIYVIGNDDLDDMLEPFQQNNMGTVDEHYLEFVDCTEEVQKEWNDYPLTCLAESGGVDYKTIEAFATKYWGYEEQDGKFGYVENPNAKWDWWEIGGRWSGLITTSKGEKTDQAFIEEIDLAKLGSTSAILYNGKWIESEVENRWEWTDKETEVWDKQTKALFSDLPPGTQVTLVDCHI